MPLLHTINRTCLDTINYTIELVKTYLKCREHLSFFNGPYILKNKIIIGIFIDLECVRKFGFKTEFMIHMFTNCIILHKKWNRKPWTLHNCKYLSFEAVKLMKTIFVYLQIFSQILHSLGKVASKMTPLNLSRNPTIATTLSGTSQQQLNVKPSMPSALTSAVPDSSWNPPTWKTSWTKKRARKSCPPLSTWSERTWRSILVEISGASVLHTTPI